MNIDHLGLVVKSITKGIKQWVDCFGYSQMTEETINVKQKVKVVFMEKPESLTIKLLEPLNEDSPIYAFARRGGGLHHICFKVGNLKAEISQLKTTGLHLISPPAPGEAFENNDIAFMLAKNNLNIELIDTEKKANIIKE
ncbi:VOC family protein [Labilibacter marinus]|uniref:VOC family protein n=1 Tax=Labilibacter marinus TaxID=1477105 RepID=UPI0008299DDA|nr:VOC family protein [Labilibacter marinus]